MGQGRSNAGGVAIVTVALLCLLLNSEIIVNAATYQVGDSGGWTFDVVDWPKGKQFKAGDTLVFKYSPSAHVVDVVNKEGYDGCSVPEGSKVFRTENDQILLVKGTNYFICDFPGHCESGMKIAVDAE